MSSFIHLDEDFPSSMVSNLFYTLKIFSNHVFASYEQTAKQIETDGTAEKMVFNVIIKYIEIMKYGKFEPLELFLSNKKTMKNNERLLIIKLIKLFKEMYGIIVSNPNNDINYGKRTIKNISGIN